MVAQLLSRLGSAAARRLGGKNSSGTIEEALMRGAEGSTRLKNIMKGTAATAAGGSALEALSDAGEKSYKERTGELASSKLREKVKSAAREAKMEAETQDVKRPYMAPKEKKPVTRKLESASINPPPSSVRENYPKVDENPVSDEGHVKYDAPDLEDNAPFAKGGSIGRGMGAATRGGGCVMKRAAGGQVMSRGVAKRGFGKEKK